MKHWYVNTEGGVRAAGGVSTAAICTLRHFSCILVQMVGLSQLLVQYGHVALACIHCWRCKYRCHSYLAAFLSHLGTDGGVSSTVRSIQAYNIVMDTLLEV